MTIEPTNPFTTALCEIISYLGDDWRNDPVISKAIALLEATNSGHAQTQPTHQEVRVQLLLTLWLPTTLDEENIGVLVREGIQKGFVEEISEIMPDRYLDIIEIREEADIYGTNDTGGDHA